MKKHKKRLAISFCLIPLLALTTLLLISCGENPSADTSANTTDKTSIQPEPDPRGGIGVGPIQKVTFAAIDDKMVQSGQAVFETKCTACHKVDKKYIGPPMAGILERRTPEWTMNMILNPEEMVKVDPVAMSLFQEYMYVPMANQSLTEEEARSIVEYFRTLKSVSTE